MDIKQTLISILTITLILAIGVGGYFLIINLTKKKLAQLEKEALTTKTVDTGEGEKGRERPEEGFQIIQGEEPPLPSVRRIVLPNQPKTEQTSSITLQPEPRQQTYSLNQKINLRVVVSVPGDQGQGEIVDGVEFLLNYDPNLITIDQKEISQGTFFSLYPQKKADQEKGEVRVIAIQDPNQNKKLTQETLVTIPLTLKQKGETTLTFDKTKTHIAAYGGQDLLQTANPLTLKVE